MADMICFYINMDCVAVVYINTHIRILISNLINLKNNAIQTLIGLNISTVMQISAIAFNLFYFNNKSDQYRSHV